jgi:uncharacterized damage-inducible protein DinB
MSLIEHFQMLARYNGIVNRRLYDACSRLEDAEYRRQRAGSMGSIHALLNHILFGDRAWMARLENIAKETPPNVILYDEFASLRAAREAEDARIERFMGQLTDGFLSRNIESVNSRGIAFSDPVPLAIAHMFNHQTHHRGQIHVMLSQIGGDPISLDMHRAINPGAAAER